MCFASASIMRGKEYNNEVVIDGLGKACNHERKIFMTKIPLSPFRYPGGKTRFAPTLATIIAPLSPDVFHEPMCGGASCSMFLLGNSAVDSVVLSDADTLMRSAWKAMVESPQDVIDALRALPITLDTWKTLRATPDSDGDTVERGARAIFMNRTSFSGVLHSGGPIGGMKQDEVPPKNPIDCRFNREAIEASIARIGQWGRDGRITVLDSGYEKHLPSIQAGEVAYFDPPYIHKSQELYGVTFTVADHADLSLHLQGLADKEVSVFLSYDDEPEVRYLYQPPTWSFINPSWAYSMGGDKTSREILISNEAWCIGV